MENFIQTTDYNKQIRAQILGIITSDDTDTLHDAEQAAQEEMESYLRTRFDVGVIFDLEQLPEDRKKIIVMYIVDMAVYHLHSNITPDNIPEIRELRYQRALKWLQKVADGKLTPNLPVIDNPDDPFANGGSQFFYGGSNEKVTERY